MKIHPTRTCFDDATYYVAAQMVHDPEFDAGEWRIVHGLCLLENGTPYAHAWIERNGSKAIGCGLVDGERVYYTADRRDFYRHFRPQELIRYTVDDVIGRETGGPWDERYRQFCGDTTAEFKL